MVPLTVAELHSIQVCKTFYWSVSLPPDNDRSWTNSQDFSPAQNWGIKEMPLAIDSKHVIKTYQLFNGFFKWKISPTPPKVLSSGYLTTSTSCSIFFLGGILVEVGMDSRRERLFVIDSKFRPSHHWISKMSSCFSISVILYSENTEAEHVHFLK